MPIMTYGGFKRMTGFCKTRVPQAILDVLESNKDNEEATKVGSLCIALGLLFGAKTATKAGAKQSLSLSWLHSELGHICKHPCPQLLVHLPLLTVPATAAATAA